jgi:hypothetical protein
MFNQETTLIDTTQLAEQAREAYRARRTREALSLAKELALADPGNSEAEALLSAIGAEIQQDLNDARALLEQAGSPDDEKKYRKAAELILLKTLRLDPDNVGAKTLMQRTR